MIYFLDGNQRVIKIVRSEAVISAIQTQELPEDNSLLRDYLSVRLKNDERLFSAQYMAIKSYGGNRNAFDLYRIASEIVPDNATEFVGVQVAPHELEGVVIEDLRPQNRPLNQTMNQVLEDSDWRLGYISDNLPNVTTNFYYMSVKDALKKIQELTNTEMVFKVEISGNKITDKWVEVYHQLGNRTMKRFNYGTNALSVVRESSHDELYTALIGRGKGEEVGETESGDATYGRKINFADVEWKKSAGNPVDKPKGQKYIELPNATAEYGIKLIDGRKVPRIGIVEFNDTDDPEILIQETYQELLVRARPKVLFKASVINTGDMLIGDTVTIHRHDLGFHYQARVRKVVRDRKNNNRTQVEIGDVVHTPSTKRQGQINSALNSVASDLENVRGEITEARSSADGKNTNFYGNVEPERKKVGDTWFRDHPSLTGESQILVWNGEAWELIMDTSETTKNADAIKEQQKEIDEAKEVADEALSEIDVAIRNAGFTSLDDTIKSVQSRANTAFDTANDLIGEVSGYSQTVDGFNQTVNNYTNQVANFRSDVNGFSSIVASYSADVRGYATQVSTLTNEVDGFNSTVSNIDGRVTSLSTTVNGISSTVSGLGGRVSVVEQTAAGLQTTVASKASQSQVTQLSTLINSTVTTVDGHATQISQLHDNINLRVTSTELNNAIGGKADKNQLITQINLSPDTALIQSKNILLDGDVTVRGTAWMDGAVLKDLSVDGAKIQDATIGSAKIANLDVNKISGNLTNFVQSNWNSATGGSVRATGDGILSTASDNSQVYIQNGIMGVRNPQGASLGHIGYNYTTNRAFYNIQTSLGTNFSISALMGSSGNTTRYTMMDIFPGSSETYIRTDDFRHVGATGSNTTPLARFSGNVAIDGNLSALSSTLTIQQIDFRYGSWIYDDSRNSILHAVGGTGLRFWVSGASSSGSKEVLRFDSTYGYMYQNLSMEGNNITNQSDERLKTNILDHRESSLDKISRFNFVDFRWIKDGKADFGVIAQQVQKVAPELILEGADGYLNLNNSLLNMITTHAVQELNKKHKTVAQTVNSHTSTLHTLQQELSQANRKIKELEEQIA